MACFVTFTFSFGRLCKFSGIKIGLSYFYYIYYPIIPKRNCLMSLLKKKKEKADNGIWDSLQEVTGEYLTWLFFNTQICWSFIHYVSYQILKFIIIFSVHSFSVRMYHDSFEARYGLLKHWTSYILEQWD